MPWIGRSAGRQPWPASSSPSSSGLFSYHDGRLLSVLRLGVVEGRVQGIHVHADPDRLAGLGGVRFRELISFDPRGPVGREVFGYRIGRDHDD